MSPPISTCQDISCAWILNPTCLWILLLKLQLLIGMLPSWTLMLSCQIPLLSPGCIGCRLWNQKLLLNPHGSFQNGNRPWSLPCQGVLWPYDNLFVYCIYWYIDLNLHMTKGYRRFVCDWCNLIHDDICWVNGCKTVPHYLIILSFFDDDTLSGMTNVWWKFTQKLVHWNQMTVTVFLVHSLPNQLWVSTKVLEFPCAMNSSLLLEDSSKVNWDGHPCSNIQFVCSKSSGVTWFCTASKVRWTLLILAGVFAC